MDEELRQFRVDIRAGKFASSRSRRVIVGILGRGGHARVTVEVGAHKGKRATEGPMLELDRTEFEKADVIIAIDTRTGSEIIYYGRSLIQLIAQGYEEEREVTAYFVRVPIDFSEDSMEPELLAAACLDWKGSCDETEE